MSLATTGLRRSRGAATPRKQGLMYEVSLNQHLVAITISVPVEDLSDRGPEGVTRNNFHMY